MLIRGLGNGVISTLTPKFQPGPVLIDGPALLEGGPTVSAGGNPNFDETLARFKTPIPLALVSAVPIDYGKIEPSRGWLLWVVGGVLVLALLGRGR